ncbi:MAG: MFS transporter [Candidatus Auribacterota bacterium]|nr:MFS transporter [Candidatus Auribacterota bacterium]
MSAGKKSLRGYGWNFAMGLLHGIFYNGGIAFTNVGTVLPVFLDNFTTSKILIGFSSVLMGPLGGIGSALPQLITAHRIESRTRKKPFLVAAIVVRALCWAALALITYFFSLSHPGFVVVSFLFLITVFTFMGGVAAVPFFDIWGKAIPANLRGKFFGYRQLGGGVMAIAAGWIVKRILGDSSIVFPDNYFFLFLLCFIFISISYMALGSLKEPIAEVHKYPLPFREFLKKSLRILKADHNFRRFIIVQIMMGSAGMALPFYVLYARNILKVELGMVGIFLSAQMAGGLISNIIWAHLSDLKGNKLIIVFTALISFLIPLLAMIIPIASPAVFLVVFVAIGFFINGRSIGSTNFLLDIAPARDRPTYISIKGTLALPIVLYPLIGGVIIQYFPYMTLFIISGLLSGGAFIASCTLKEPRRAA